MTFTSVSVDEMTTAVSALLNKCCTLDTFSISTLKTVIGDLAPFLTELVNCSLSTEIFKEAYITPRLKKIDPSGVRLYRPTSNLSVISKLLEKIVARQLISHLNSAGLLPSLQSTYRLTTLPRLQY